MAQVINLIPVSGIIQPNYIDGSIPLSQRVEGLMRRVAEGRVQITSEIDRITDMFLRGENYFFTNPKPGYYFVDQATEVVLWGNRYYTEVGMTVPVPEIKVSERQLENVGIKLFIQSNNPKKLLSPGMCRELNQPNRYKFALYDHWTKLISEPKGLEVIKNRSFAFANLRLDQCTLKPDLVMRGLELAIKTYEPKSEKKYLYHYSLIPFIDGVPVVPF